MQLEQLHTLYEERLGGRISPFKNRGRAGEYFSGDGVVDTDFNRPQVSVQKGVAGVMETVRSPFQGRIGLVLEMIVADYFFPIRKMNDAANPRGVVGSQRLGNVQVGIAAAILIIDHQRASLPKP